MSQFKSKKQRSTQLARVNEPSEVFSFGEPEQVSRDEVLSLFKCEASGKWWEPPVPFEMLSKAFRSAVYHSSPIHTKVNILVSLFEPHAMLTVTEFEKIVLDFFVFGNAYIECVRNRLGGVLKLKAMPTKYMRNGLDDSFYYLANRSAVSGGLGDRLGGVVEPMVYGPDQVIHLVKPDIDQEIYGIPEYLAALPSAWLNNEATLFRLRYYRNGSHAGVILYLTDSTQSPEDVDLIKDKIKQSKGPGNFRNLFIYAPNGKKDGLQVIPMSEIAAKDEFFNIKCVTRDDLLAAHRVPRELMSIPHDKASGALDLNKVAKVFALHELMPVMRRLDEVNQLLGEDVFTFKTYIIEEPVPV